MKIRKRGSSWQLDFGVIDGHRVQRTFRTKEEAQQILNEASSFGPNDVLNDLNEAQVLESTQRANVLLLLEIQGKDREIAHLKRVLEERVIGAKLAPDALGVMRHQLMPVPISASPGIYFLCYADELVYIGQALCFLRRISRHKERKRFPFDAAWWMPCASEDLTKTEYLLIQRFRPVYNKRLSQNEPLEYENSKKIQR